MLTGDGRLAQRVRELKDQWRPVRGTGGDDAHPALGFNFKLTNLQAAVGLAQLSELGPRLARQKRIHELYREGLANVPGLRLPPFRFDRGEVPLWTDAVVDRRDALDLALAALGMGCRRFWHPLHVHPPYARPAEGFPQATTLSAHALWLPSAFTLTDTEVAGVVAAIRTVLA